MFIFVDNHTKEIYNNAVIVIKRVFPILAIAIFAAMLGIGIIVPLLPIYANELGATGPQLGMIFAGYGIVNTIATPIVGRFSDLRGRKLFLCFGLFFYTLLSLSYTLVGNIGHLIIIRFVQGIAGALVFPISMAYVGDLAPENEEGKWMGYANAAFFSGYGIGPLLGGVIGEYWGRNFSFYTMGGFCLLALLITIPFLPESRIRKAKERLKFSLKEIGASGIVRGVFTYRLVQAMARASLSTFLPLFVADRAGLGPALTGVLLAVNMLSITLLTAPAGTLVADRFNRRGIIVFGNLLYMASLALIPMATNFWFQILLCVPRGIGGAISMTAASALTVEEGRKFGMGSTMSILMMAMGIGMAVGPVAAGAIFDWLNINSAFYFAAVVSFVGTIVFAWFTRKS